MHDLTADIERLRAEPVRDPAGLRLDGRAAFITGCDQGIGRGVMRGFLARGAQVAAGVHDPANIPAVAPALGVAVDVRDGATLHRAAAAAAQRFGRIDTVVCNAGIYPRCDAAAMDEATWRGVVDVNLDGAFRTVQACLPHLISAGGGSIILVGSMAHRLGRPNLAHYHAAKAGLIGLCRGLARDLGRHGIRVNVIDPGAVETETDLRMFPDRAQELREVNALQSLPGRLTPASIEPVFAFFASPLSGDITGQAIIADRGWAHG